MKEGGEDCSAESSSPKHSLPSLIRSEDGHGGEGMEARGQDKQRPAVSF